MGWGGVSSSPDQAKISKVLSLSVCREDEVFKVESYVSREVCRGRNGDRFGAQLQSRVRHALDKAERRREREGLKVGERGGTYWVLSAAPFG